MRDQRPGLVAHADWGSIPLKRWMCVSELSHEGGFRVAAPELVGEPSTLLTRLRDRAAGGAAAVGFDFPIGVPSSYAARAEFTRFKDVLPELGSGQWSRFYEVTESWDEINVKRPFYPQRPGGTKQKHLTDALGVPSIVELLRVCERANNTRGAASPLFWTLGGKQVGKAAIIGWRDVLGPALKDPDLDVSIWPFDGELTELLTRGEIVIAETYPAEACLHLGMAPPGRGWSKRSPEGRRAQAAAIREWATARPVTLEPALTEQIDDGFGPSKDAEDPFDAVIGLLSMLEVVLGYRSAGAPDTPSVREVEGWILGQQVDDAAR